MPRDHQDALIELMMLMSASDGEMSDRELDVITDDVSTLPVFEGFDLDRLNEIGGEVAQALEDPDGLRTALDRIAAALPPSLRETAYALAVEVAAADGSTEQEELRLLEMIRARFRLADLVVAAIERTARARLATL